MKRGFEHDGPHVIFVPVAGGGVAAELTDAEELDGDVEACGCCLCDSFDCEKTRVSLLFLFGSGTCGVLREKEGTH